MALSLLLIFLLWLAAYLLTRWLHRQGRADRHNDVLAAGLLALACTGYFWRVLAGDVTMPGDGGDLISFLYPTYRFAAESLRSGQLPLWNPHLYGGAPHVADIQAGFLYPPNLILFLLKPDFGALAMQSLSILHLWWAGLGVFVFLRSLRWRIGRPAALAAGLAFMFSDPFWTHFGNLNLIAVASWLPWVMACFVRSIEWKMANGERRMVNGGGVGWALLGGVLLGIGTLAGHIQATLFIGLAVVIYGLFWLYGEGQNSEFRVQNSEFRVLLWRFVSRVGVVGIVGALVAAPVLLPALQLAGYTDRAAWTYQNAAGYSLSPPQWIGLLVPGFFGRGPQLHWGPWPRVEAGYIGVLPLALAGLALLARRERGTWNLLGLSGVAFLLSLGIYSIPHGWLSLLPGFDLLRAPARLVLLVDFGLAALAGVGLQVLLDPIGEGENWRALNRLLAGLQWAAKVALAVIVPLTFAALLLAQDKEPGIYIRVAVAAIALLLFIAFLLGSLSLIAARKAGWARPKTLAVLALLLIFLDHASTGAYFDIGEGDPTAGFQHPEIVAFLAQETEPFRLDARTDIQQLWQPDTALLAGLDDVWGIVNPSTLAHIERYWEGMGSRSNRLYDFLNARYVIGRKDVALDWGKFELAFEGDPDLNVYRNRDVLPRAFVVHEALAAWDEAAAWDMVHAPDFDPAGQVVVQPGEAALPDVQPAAGAERVTWLRRDANRLDLEVTVSAPGYLVLSEVWYPGWQATVAGNGRTERQPVLRANTGFRAIPLWEAGTYRVTLHFAPLGWRIGLALSGATLLLLAVGAVVMRRRRRMERGG